METWLEVLQAEVAASSLAQVAEKLGLSRTTISQVCNEKYPGDMARVQTLVEGALMGNKVRCPILGGYPGSSVSRSPTPWPERSGQQSDGYQALEGMPQRLPP
ncbi:helix-turn-helix domain-containing protein [Aeromonas veronii]|uniref:helix-turn-helix domain-containing protein n=1 Tax=Aeromonas veronii TaxID=654 RepID=UPI0024440D9C|nr:helix-turn-helix transcriptional regulator [Aeromonas veronii]